MWKFDRGILYLWWIVLFCCSCCDYYLVNGEITIFHDNDQNQLILKYDFPPIIEKNWTRMIQITKHDPYNCFALIEEDSLVVSHSCIVTYNISLDRLYNYCFLHLSQLPPHTHPNGQNSKESPTETVSSIHPFQSESYVPFVRNSLLTPFVTFRLFIDITRADQNFFTPVEIYIDFTIPQLFKQTILLPAKDFLTTTPFSYDFHLPIPMNIIQLYEKIEQYHHIHFQSFNHLQLKMLAWIRQNNNILPIQNYNWNREMIKLRFSKFHIDYIPPSRQ